MNILLLSSIYPIPNADNHGTKVCHYFAKEWKEQGHNVQSIHIQAVYPRPLYWCARFCRNRIAAKTGAVVYTTRDKGESYEMDGVPVTRIPVFKPIPHGKFSKWSTRSALRQIIEQTSSRRFVPEIILAHFLNPQIEILNMLKACYPQVKNALILHGDIDLAKRVYGKKFPELMDKIDCWGFRNRRDKERFEHLIGPVKSFMCYSGVPESYITIQNTHEYTKPLEEFVYVGEMIERKYPSKVIDALQEVYPDGNWHINYVGEGQQLSVIKEKISANHLEENVTMLGRIPRDQIKSIYDAADCMVMISRGEVYGLVYLEAMARGCITIASKNGGIDGVIEDGVNGFLCKEGNADELALVIKRINDLTVLERQQISRNAVNTAKKMTDYLVARKYLEDVINLI